MGLSKNFSFWTASLDLDAMFKIKSLLYKDLILNSLSAMLMRDVEKVTNFWDIPTAMLISLSTEK